MCKAAAVTRMLQHVPQCYSCLSESALRCAVLCCAVLCCAVLCCAALFCVLALHGLPTNAVLTPWNHVAEHFVLSIRPEVRA